MTREHWDGMWLIVIIPSLCIRVDVEIVLSFVAICKIMILSFIQLIMFPLFKFETLHCEVGLL